MCLIEMTPRHVSKIMLISFPHKILLGWHQISIADRNPRPGETGACSDNGSNSSNAAKAMEKVVLPLPPAINTEEEIP